MAALWVDTHCHLDAFEFGDKARQVRELAGKAGVQHCVIPAVELSGFEKIRELAHQTGDSFCLGIHPLYVANSDESDLQELRRQLEEFRDDPRLVAVGEIGLDYFVQELGESPLREKQEFFYREQLKLARDLDLPVVLHVRRSADRVLKHLREIGAGKPWLGIAHAFNGSKEQAEGFISQGLKLGFGGALTFERALQLRRLAQTLPGTSIVLETDAPDIAPQWLYVSAQKRAEGQTQMPNTPAELPRIAEVMAQLRGMSVEELATLTTANACAALPGITKLLNN